MGSRLQVEKTTAMWRKPSVCQSEIVTGRPSVGLNASSWTVSSSTSAPSASEKWHRNAEQNQHLEAEDTGNQRHSVFRRRKRATTRLEWGSKSIPMSEIFKGEATTTVGRGKPHPPRKWSRRSTYFLGRILLGWPSLSVAVLP